MINRFCKEYLPDGSCVELIESKYDLAEKATRESLRSLGFACRVGPKFFTVCPDVDGICRSYGGGWFSNPKVDTYLLKSQWKFLVQADTKCFQRDTYPFLGE